MHEMRQTFRMLHPVMRATLLVAAVLAVGYTARLAFFMVDANRTHYSVLDRPFFRTHSCLSSYTEAARLAAAGVNVFDPDQYADRNANGEHTAHYIGPFEVDLYQYPPPFLLLPEAGRSVGWDFFTIRTGWFVVQIGVLLGGLILTARWIGGVPGALAAIFIPLLFLAPTTRLTLQIGNFQLTAFPLAVLAMIAFARGRTVAGGVTLGLCAVSKIFPGVLGLVLLMQRQWRAAAATMIASVLLVVVALATLGSKPFMDFVFYQLPRIDSGAAFFWIEFPVMAPVNQSVYGLVTKLRAFGVPGTGAAGARVISTIYAVVLIGVAVVGVRRLERLTSVGVEPSLVRLRHAQLWLGLLSLASFRSPFVPDAYGLVGTLWLLTLLAAERPRLARWTLLVVAGAVFSIVLDGGLVPTPVPIWLIVATLAIQLCAYGINLVVVLAPHRRFPGTLDREVSLRARPVPAPAGLAATGAASRAQLPVSA